jgi:hypothetical protein
VHKLDPAPGADMKAAECFEALKALSKKGFGESMR